MADTNWGSFHSLSIPHNSPSHHRHTAATRTSRRTSCTACQRFWRGLCARPVRSFSARFRRTGNSLTLLLQPCHCTTTTPTTCHATTSLVRSTAAIRRSRSSAVVLDAAAQRSDAFSTPLLVLGPGPSTLPTRRAARGLGATRCDRLLLMSHALQRCLCFELRWDDVMHPISLSWLHHRSPRPHITTNIHHHHHHHPFPPLSTTTTVATKHRYHHYHVNTVISITRTVLIIAIRIHRVL
jgi:hypothetical protein